MDVLRAATTTDLLAMVPALAGFAPSRSVVCVPFHGTRTTVPVMRVDLPERRREADFRRLAEYLTGTLSRVPGVDRVAVIVYTDLTFTQERGIPYLDLGRALERSLGRAGFDLVESACVAADGWGSYLERAHREEGRPLAELSSPRVQPQGDLLAGADIPTAPPERRALVAGLLERASTLPLWELDFTEVVEGALDARELTPLAAAGLLAALRSPALRDVVLLQSAFGREVGESAFDEQERWSQRSAETGLSMDELAAEDLAAGLVLDDGLLLGRTDRVPSRERLEAGCELHRRLAAVAPEELLPPVLTSLAWLNWALGRGSAAGALLDRVLALDPSYGMAQLLATWFATGALPDWAFTPPQGSRG